MPRGRKNNGNIEKESILECTSKVLCLQKTVEISNTMNLGPIFFTKISFIFKVKIFKDPEKIFQQLIIGERKVAALSQSRDLSFFCGTGRRALWCYWRPRNWWHLREAGSSSACFRYFPSKWLSAK